ncbi:SdpI family protein [Nocardia pseudovaccinii]|uniref:SdpI family protein n=1 Tax=Nocardia pseudovaccinii TaxID=189540 RepID=UPI0007A4AB5C|nr:SdpI family protein [Nocardia pseudovaccinii]
MFVVALTLFVLAMVAIATGVLGLTGRLPRNRFVGVHTEAALHDEETFRIANRVAAPTSVAAGALLFAGGLVALAAGGFPALIVAVVTAMVALFTLGAGANAAARAVEELVPVQEIGGCGSSCGACSLREACAPTD